MDVKTAFLNEKLEEKLNMKIHEGVTAHKEIVCKLKTSAYDLKQSPRCFKTRFNKFILHLGFHRSKNDYC